ncbi:CRISPR-associated endoribonuclease Cas6 [Anaerovorax odorimutans]|uniref:CRISPR-associated endoribonuclease Cas6 n=1 Tax=Anaerovorax odorimutans TaxID=109327 RepID=UPI00040187C2|nr:CRISPR-associated endoribonuclease Cas6 [Anaerovorax odorimutans]
MKFIELVVTVILKKDIYFADSGYVIGKNINKLMLLDKDLRELHVKKQYKNYVFNSFYPLEKDKLYKKGKAYVFKIRGLDDEFMKKVHKYLKVLDSDDFDVISAAFEEIEQGNIRELYTLTPVIITIDDRPWLQNNDLHLFIDRLESNLEKKYKSFFNESIDIKGKLIENIRFKNKVPMSFNYKNVKLLGNKISIDVKENIEAQKTAFLALAVGIGEKNSAVGAGFCNRK